MTKSNEDSTEEFELDLNNAEFQQVLSLISTTRSSVYMTGRAGTGKSTFLKYIVSHVNKKIVVLAPTGIAAVNAGGVTLHSFFKIPQRPLIPGDTDFYPAEKLLKRQKYSREKLKLLQNLELIVIDEISMVRADILDFINHVLQSVMPRGSRQRREPFGGKQLLLVGDAFQLEPVTKAEDRDILHRFYSDYFFFNARIFGSLHLVNIELKKVYRQNEQTFLSLLDRVRVNALTANDLQLINSRYDKNFEASDDELYITLCTRRDSADFINETHLGKLDTKEAVYEAEVWGEFAESSFPTSKVLTLKVGAQVIFVKNDKEHRWYNGTIARVVDVDETGVWVEDENLERNFVEVEEWSNVRYRYNEEEEKVEEEVIGSFKQIPLNLAWAITIHKSQGLTFDRAIIDIGSGAFACGQSYVALSRCRTLEGIILRTPMSQRDIRVNNSVVLYSKQMNDQRDSDDHLRISRSNGLFKMARISFAHRDFQDAVRSFCEAAKLCPEAIERPAVQRLIAKQFGVINRLENEIEGLILDKRKREDELRDFAEEYYLLSAECIHKYNEKSAAIGNLNKCLRLNPKHVNALLLRAAIHCDCGEYEDAIADCNLALSLHPTNTKSLRQRAMIYSKMRRYDEAYADLHNATIVNDSEAVSFRMLANVCEKLGFNDEADEYNDIADSLERLPPDDDQSSSDDLPF